MLVHGEFYSGGIGELQVILSGALPKATNKSQRKLARVCAEAPAETLGCLISSVFVDSHGLSQEVV